MVSPGDKLQVEKLDVKEGQAEVIFSEVLLCDKDGKLQIGAPFIKGAEVKAKVLGEKKGDKLIIFKYKSKKRYKRKIGHRQKFTEVEIISIT